MLLVLCVVDLFPNLLIFAFIFISVVFVLNLQGFSSLLSCLLSALIFTCVWCTYTLTGGAHTFPPHLGPFLWVLLIREFFVSCVACSAFKPIR